jgi:hypothetical protein
MRLFTTLCVLFFLLFDVHDLAAQCPTGDAGSNQQICAGGSVQIGPALLFPNSAYSWSPQTGLSNPNIANPVASPTTTTTYTLTVSSATPTGSNLLINGDFGLGNFGFTGSPWYTYIPPYGTSSAGHYTITSSPSNVASNFCSTTDEDGNNSMLVVDGSVKAGSIFWAETVNVTPNTNYIFSGWLLGASSLPPGQVVVIVNGNVVYGPSSNGACTWQQMLGSWNSGSATQATIQMYSASNLSLGNDMAIDNLGFYTSCYATPAPITVSVVPVVAPVIVSGSTQEGSAAAQPLSNFLSTLPGQYDVCAYWEDGLQLTLNANKPDVLWYIDGVQVSDGTQVASLSGVVSITNGGQTLSVGDGINDFGDHSFQVGPVAGGCGPVSTATNIRRVPLMLMQGAGYQEVNTLGTIFQRNTAYTFNLATRTPNYLANYGPGGLAYQWSVPGCTATPIGPWGSQFMVSVTVPTGVTPSVDPVSGNHYIPGTVVISGSEYACLFATYSINFAVPSNFPNRSYTTTLTGQPASMDDPDGAVMQVFPNPATDILSIQSALPMDGDAYVEIFSSAGVRVRLVRAAEQPGMGVLQVNVAGLGKGLYFAALHTGGDIIRRKFLIAR